MKFILVPSGLMTQVAVKSDEGDLKLRVTRQVSEHAYLPAVDPLSVLHVLGCPKLMSLVPYVVRLVSICDGKLPCWMRG